MRWLVCVLLLFASTASAAEPTAAELQRARDFYDAATRHFRGGDMDQAATEFKAAYELSGNVELLWNLAQTHRLAKHNEQALFFYKQYRAAKPPLTAANQAALNKRIDDLEELIQQQRRTQTAPPDGPERPADKLAPSQQARPQTSPTNAQEQQAATGMLVSSPPQSTRPWYKAPAAWALTIGGASVVVVGGVLIGAGLSEGAEARKASTQDQFNTHHSRDLTLQQAGWPILGIGAAAIVSGTLVFALDSKRRHLK